MLIDEEDLSMHQAWLIVCNSFSYTSHSTGVEFKEKWPVHIVQRLLPRHLEIINDVNYFFLEKVRREHPNDPQKLQRMSIF